MGRSRKAGGVMAKPRREHTNILEALDRWGVLTAEGVQLHANITGSPRRLRGRLRYLRQTGLIAASGLVGYELTPAGRAALTEGTKS